MALTHIWNKAEKEILEEYPKYKTLERPKKSDYIIHDIEIKDPVTDEIFKKYTIIDTELKSFPYEKRKSIKPNIIKTEFKEKEYDKSFEEYKKIRDKLNRLIEERYNKILRENGYDEKTIKKAEKLVSLLYDYFDEDIIRNNPEIEEEILDILKED